VKNSIRNGQAENCKTWNQWNNLEILSKQSQLWKKICYATIAIQIAIRSFYATKPTSPTRTIFGANIV